jgi:hypothetical protein
MLAAGNLERLLTIDRLQQLEVVGAQGGPDQPPQAGVVVSHKDASLGCHQTS